MAKNRMVNTQFWEDNYVLDLDPSEKLLFLYFLTNSRTNIAGIYEINKRKISMETGFDRDMVDKIIARFAADNRLYYIEGHIVVRNFTKHQQRNPSVKKGIAREILDLPDRLRKFVVLDDDGLYLEVGGDLTLLSREINRRYMAEYELQQSVPSLSQPNLTQPNLTKHNGNTDHRSYPQARSNLYRSKRMP